MDDLYNKARNVYELTPDDFNIKSLKGRVQMKKFLGSDGFIVFYAPWCHIVTILNLFQLLKN